MIGEHIELVCPLSKEPHLIKIDPSQLDQLLANLCINARDAIEGTGQISIDINSTHLDQNYGKTHAGAQPGDYIQLAVRDDGCGMDAATREKIFEPFFTTKKAGEGTGLGLSTVYGIVKQNNGFIQVDSEPGRGTSFCIYLPRQREEDLEPQLLNQQTIPRGQEQVILVVEDETAILKLTQAMLEQLGYQVLSAASPTAALALVEAHPQAIDLLLTDVVMPQMDGHQLAETLHKNDPQMKVLFMSGYPSDILAHHGVLHKGIHFLQKPFNETDLAIRVQQALKS